MLKAIIGILLILAALAGLVVALPKVAPRDAYPWSNAQQDAPGRSVPTGKYSTHYVDMGGGDPVILLHGYLYHSVTWEQTQVALSRSLHTFAVDLYGWGYSSRFHEKNYSYDVYARQVVDFMDAMNIDSAHLIGHSMGGGTAITVASKWPDRVKKIVLVDSAGLPNPLPVTGEVFALPYVGEFLVAFPGRALFRKNLRDLWFFDSALVTDEYVDTVIEPLRITGSSRSILSILRDMDFGGLDNEIKGLASTNKPTLIVWGRDDRAVPLPLGKKIHSLLPGSRFVEIPEAGHSPHEEKADQVNPLILDFLTAP